MREYVEKTLHTRVDCEPVDASGLPLYLRGLYSLERWTAFGVPFAVASPVESPTVKTMAKHRDALEAALGTPVSFALEGATGYRVGRMLEAGLPFIAPDRQVYLPFLGIALSSGRSHARDAQAGIPHAPQVECNFLLRQKVIAAPHLREAAEPWLH